MILARYPANYKQAAIIPLLDLAQRQVSHVTLIFGDVVMQTEWRLAYSECYGQGSESGRKSSHGCIRSSHILYYVQPRKNGQVLHSGALSISVPI